MFEDDLDLITQAINNVGQTFGGHTRTAFLALSKEIKRLKRCREEQEAKARRQQEIDDDIPF